MTLMTVMVKRGSPGNLTIINVKVSLTSLSLPERTVLSLSSLSVIIDFLTKSDGWASVFLYFLTKGVKSVTFALSLLSDINVDN